MMENKKTIQGKSWKDFVPAYLSIMNDFYLYGQNVPVLFVEGPEDKKFYSQVFPLSLNGYDMKVKKEDIFIGKFYPPEDEQGKDYIQLFGNSYFKKSLNVKYKDMKKDVNDVIRQTSNGIIKNCDFVEEVGKVCKKISDSIPINKKLIVFKHINGFGIADRDFKLDTYISQNQWNKNNLSYTCMHDYETSIFYLYFPLLCKGEYKNDETFVVKLSRLLEFVGKQGVLQMCSTQYKIIGLKYITYFDFIPEKMDNNKYKKIITDNNPTEIFFKSDCLNNSYFDFEGFLNAQVDEEKKPFQDLPVQERPYNISQIDQQGYNKFYNSFLKDVKNVFNSSFDFYGQTEKWLNDEENQLEKVFQYANGHILWKHFIKIFGEDKYYPFKTDNDLTDFFVDYIKKHKDILLEYSPLKQYMEFRLDG